MLRFKKKSTRRLFTDILFYIFALLFLIFFLLPLWTLVVGGFSSLDSVLTGKSILFPNPFSWNWPSLVSQQSNPTPLRHLLNSFIISGAVVPLIFFSALTAYGLGRFKGPGQNIVFFAIMSTMMLPFTVTMIPRFIMFKSFGWNNTYIPFYVPAICGSAPAVFLLRQFMKTVPMDIEAAARIDGAGHFRIFGQIMIPICKPALITTFIFAVVGQWNDFMTPLILLNTHSKFPITLAIMTLKADGDKLIHWHNIMLEAVLATVPLVILFFILQKYIVKGFITSGVKG